MKYLFIVFVPLALASLFIGVGEVTIAGLMSGNPMMWELLWTSRIPRLLAILLAGSGLSIAGLIMQQLSQNRFAAPSTSGTIECAGLGYVLSLVWFGDGSQLWLIFLMSLLGTAIFIYFIQSIQFKNAIFVPLIGLVFGNVVESMSHFIAYRNDVVQNLSSWMVANFSTILNGEFELLYLALPISLFCYLYATRISAAGMGRDFARNIGVNYHQVLMIGVALVSIMSAIVVIIVGQLPFLGLIVPNLVSYFYGDNLRRNIPLTALLGAILVLCCDVIGRLIIFPYEIPISMVINILGGVVFVLFVVKGRMHER